MSKVSGDVVEQVREIVSDIFQIPIEQVNLDSSPETIEAWESIQHLNLVLALEQEFGLSFSPEEMATMLSVEAISQLVSEKMVNF
ncbi:MAG: acyl carrier protein [Microcystis aeruginosa Ma_MB_F_20061100_S19]|uniref:Acyl carrier protein n=1 Tax=Microcystis aeruginosa SPC777 TaxID=482300 RepID=S3J1P0_MICAE|nr:acyl carrier protein [Microcystis aeruginosa]NCR96761.1 acyl carrier protein [Microcystis aeruginosa L311-01]OCY13022.1 MAG: acyl carrier protein [Microcystis aeruginosa CACIAM 03]TRU07904.1 MAG: acyl carrier protein [Microcystis aeruginosa Ma_MB_F_20061100_S19D]TRU13163.1 MAG: acyl carrier protein [Microcystis aeruginosa Ma_MB_F_20061100_S19]EPF19853.1 acyl carrier protein [Microcystis aeruginosa SPC777]